MMKGKFVDNNRRVRFVLVAGEFTDEGGMLPYPKFYRVERLCPFEPGTPEESEGELHYAPLHSCKGTEAGFLGPLPEEGEVVVPYGLTLIAVAVMGGVYYFIHLDPQCSQEE